MTIKFTVIHKNITDSSNKIIVCVYVWACSCVCVCVCVSNTTNLQKELQVKNVLFLWLETGSFSETGKRLIVILYECLRGPSMVLLFSPVDSRWKECVAAAKKFGQTERGCLKTTYLLKIRVLQVAQKRRTWIYARRRSFKHITWSSWPMVSRDWILSVRHLCGNKWHTAQNNL